MKIKINADKSITWLDDETGEINANDVLVHRLVVYIAVPLAQKQSLWITFYSSNYDIGTYDSILALSEGKDDDGNLFYYAQIPTDVIKLGGEWQAQVFRRSYNSESGTYYNQQSASEMIPFTVASGLPLYGDTDSGVPVTNETIASLFNSAITAKTDAEAAQEKAEQAQGKAETAETNAEKAQIAAEKAVTEAQTAQKAAETAQDNAEQAYNGADMARSEAEAYAGHAKDYAEAASESAEKAKVYEKEARDSSFAASTSESNAALSEELAAFYYTESKNFAATAEQSSDEAKDYASTSYSNMNSAKNAANEAKANVDNAISAAKEEISQNVSAAEGSAVSAETSAGSAKNSANEALATLNRVKETVKEIHKALVFDTANDFLLWYNNNGHITINGQDYTPSDLVVGDDIYIKDPNVSDLWFSGVTETDPNCYWYDLPFAKLETDTTAILGYTETAQTAASEAKDYAESASKSKAQAETAETNAINAKNLAVSAQGKAETAQSKAEAAQKAAETAQSKAETAKTDALTAQSKAETAQKAAETAQTKVEQAYSSMNIVFYVNDDGKPSYKII